jgi:hypothetical protein
MIGFMNEAVMAFGSPKQVFEGTCDRPSNDSQSYHLSLPMVISLGLRPAVMTLMRYRMTAANSNTRPDSTHRPWQIVLLLPNAQHRLIAQFRNRADAEHHLRSLQKLVPYSPFDLMFVPPNERIMPDF